MRKLSNLFMTLSVLCFALPAFAQGGGARASKCTAPPQPEVFTASRLTPNNSFWFPTRIVVSRLRVSRVKSSWFSNDVTRIAISKVSSVQIISHLLLADVRIESDGGESLIIQDLSNADAKRIDHLIALYQQDEEGCRLASR
jgi:hypothetical protein